MPPAAQRRLVLTISQYQPSLARILSSPLLNMQSTRAY